MAATVKHITSDQATISPAAEPGDAQVLSIVRHSPLIREAMDSRAAATTAERQKLLDEMGSLEATGAAARGQYDRDIGAARAAITAVEVQMRDAIGKAVAIQAEFDQGRHSRDHRRGQIETALKERSNPLINDFRRFLMDQSASAQREPIEVITIGELKNPVTGRRQAARTVTNHVSIVARLVAIRDALAGLDQLRLLADQRRVPAEIERIRTELPRITPPVVEAAHD